jgi:hypothetical protein
VIEPSAMADPRSFELEDLVNRPGTYFNPQTEVMIIVDDSPDIDSEIFDMEDYEGADWVLVSDETPVDEHLRDDLIESFQATHTPDPTSGVPADEDDVDEVDELEPDEDEVEEL